MSMPLNENIEVMRRVSQLLKERGMTLADFARSMGVLPAHVSNWKRRGLPSDRLPRAADVLSVSVDVLLGRVESMPADGIPMLLTGKVPVVGRAQLGDDNSFCDVAWYDDPDGFLPVPSKDPRAYALKCTGASMTPRIQPGEYVIAEPSVEAQPGDEVVVQDVNNRAMVKRFLYVRGGVYHFASIKKAFEDVVLEADDIKAIHPVLAIVPKKLWTA